MERHGSSSKRRQHFPQATCILDWPHLWRTIAKAIRAVGMQQQESQSWIGQQSKRLQSWLWQGQIEQVQAQLQQWRADTTGQAVKAAVDKARTYLKTQQAWIGSSARWKHQGYPVGSGIIERAVSLVINRRMKKRGMSWLRVNAAAIVALRVAFINDDWLFSSTSHSFC